MQNNKSMLILVYQSDALFYELTGSYVLFGVVPWTMALTFCFLLGVIFARFIPCPHRLDLLRNPRIQEVFITWQSVRFLSRNSCFNQCQGLIFESVSLFKQNILISKCSRLTAYCSSKLFDIAIGVFFFQIRLYGNHGEKMKNNVLIFLCYFIILSSAVIQMLIWTTEPSRRMTKQYYLKEASQNHHLQSSGTCLPKPI